MDSFIQLTTQGVPDPWWVGQQQVVEKVEAKKRDPIHKFVIKFIVYIMMAYLDISGPQKMLYEIVVVEYMNLLLDLS